MKRYWAMKWINDLERTSVRQGKKRMKSRDEDGRLAYCCLARLCVVGGDKGKKLSEQYLGREVFGFGGDLDSMVVPDDLRQKFGMSRSNPEVTLENGERHSLAHCNDQLGMSFKQIAKLIRKQWKDL
jgi:hypothetical protein